MARPPRITAPGVAYHLLNRRVMRLPIFSKDEDYAALERVLADGLDRPDAPQLLAYCLMPNHWHLVVHAGDNTDLSTWMQWVAVTHTHRWHVHYHTTGEGPLYQGRFKSFPVQTDDHFLTVCRYVVANALRAGLTDRAEAWRWNSLWVRRNGHGALRRRLTRWPVEPPWNWLADVNCPMADEALTALRQSAARGTPLGTPQWKARIANRLGLAITLHPRGRPRQPHDNAS
ncbi:MAG: transposase [Phycisphaerae bacterium]|nr:transposase [Phycisphaerae bacterium]